MFACDDFLDLESDTFDWEYLEGKSSVSSCLYSLSEMHVALDDFDCFFSLQNSTL